MHFEPDEPNNYSIERFESMLKTNEILFFDSEEFEDIADFYLDKGQISLAKKAVKLGLEQHPSSSELKLFQIEIYLIEDRLEEAEALMDEIFDLAQGNEDIYIQKANIYSRREKHPEAISCLETALEMASDPGEILTLLGMEYINMDDHEKALENFLLSLEHEACDEYTALYNIVYCYEYLDRPLDAIAFLNNYLENDPYSELAWHQLGRIYSREKDYDKALAAYDFAIISDEYFLGAYYDKGRLLEKLQRYPEAIDHYTLSMSMDAPTGYVLQRIGNCYEKLGDKEIALDFYLQSVDHDPTLSDGWIALTDFYLSENDYEKAQEYIERGLAIDGENVTLWKRYAKIHRHLGNAEEAEIGFRKALELGNFELNSWLMRSDILMELGNYDDAILNLIDAQDFYPDNAEIDFRLSGLFFSMKEPAKGEFHLRKALNSEPEFLIIIEELFPLVFHMKKVKQIVAQHKNPCS